MNYALVWFQGRRRRATQSHVDSQSHRRAFGLARGQE